MTFRICKEVMDAHAQFGGDLESMQKCYEYEDLKNKIKQLRTVLHQCETYFEARADADCDHVGFIPNEEMKILIEIREIIK